MAVNLQERVTVYYDGALRRNFTIEQLQDLGVSDADILVAMKKKRITLMRERLRQRLNEALESKPEQEAGLPFINLLLIDQLATACAGAGVTLPAPYQNFLDGLNDTPAWLGGAITIKAAMIDVIGAGVSVEDVAKTKILALQECTQAYRDYVAAVRATTTIEECQQVADEPLPVTKPDPDVS